MASSKDSELRPGDVVEVGGMRGIVREGTKDEVLVAGGRTDEGVWVKRASTELKYRPVTDPSTHKGMPRLTLDPEKDEVVVELPGTWLVWSVNPRGDYTYITVRRA